MTSVPQRLCSFEGCEKPHYAKGLCRAHWKRQYVNSKRCTETGCDKPNDTKGRCKTHYSRVWVSENLEHRRAYSRSRYELKVEEVREYNRIYYHNNKEYFAAANAKWMAEHPVERRALNRKRRALLAGSVSEPYTESDILGAHGTSCHLCSVEIDLSAPRQPGGGQGWELGLHLDHVIPLSKGGTDLIENVKPSHVVCNLAKKDRIMGE